MRLLLVSDLHYTLRQFDWVLETAADVDAVVVAGDHLDLASGVPLETQIVAVRAWIRTLAGQGTTVVCSGNHDLTARNAHDEKAAPWIEDAAEDGAVVDWATLDHGDVRITVCPWWDGEATRDDVGSQLARDAVDRPTRWIWIYHFPPDGAATSWIGSRHIGDPDLNHWIERFGPDLVLTGHIHDAPFLDGGSWLARLGKTAVGNAGHAPGPVPAHVEIDTTTGRAMWWSPYGSDEADLWS